MRKFIITTNDANQRLDRFIKKLLPNASASLVYKLNRKNKIKVNSKREDNEYKLQVWDQVKVFLRDDEFEILTKPKANSKVNTQSKLSRKDIVYEDGDLLIINKEPWLNVHPWDYKTKETNLIYQVRDYLWDKLNSLTFKPSLVHRIDRDTSWIVLIAKKKDILKKLVSDFKTHNNIKKIYYAIVLWKMPHSFWVIKDRLKRIENAKNENKVQVSLDGQEAITKYKVLKNHVIKIWDKNQNIQELELEIETWRMHQIRVHLSHIWCPIIWDNKYWCRKINSYLNKNFSVTRQLLHAWKIEFIHYNKSKKVLFEARFKNDILSFLEKIK